MSDITDFNEPEIINKIKKLLALSESPNPNEAQASMIKAHDLLEKYNIDLAKVNKKIDEIVIIEGFKGNRAREWFVQLVNSVTYANYCSCYIAVHHHYKDINSIRRSSEFTIQLVGKEVNIVSCKLMIDYLLKTIKRLSEAQKGAGHLAIESYKVGLVITLSKRLYEIRNNSFTTNPEAKDIILYNDAEVKNKVKDICKNSKDRPNKLNAKDTVGYLAGLMDGKNISLNSQLKEQNFNEIE
jgi:hypothetical protein